MNEKQLKNIIQKSQNAVKEMNESDEAIRRAAFDKLFEFYKSMETGVKDAPIPSKGEQDSDFSNDFWGDLSKKTGVQTEKLKDIYSIDASKNALSVIHIGIKGESKKEKRTYLALLVLLAYQNGYEMDWVPASDLKRIAEELSLYDSKRFSQSLKSDDFRSIGKKKGTKYKLSLPGVQKATEYLKEIAG